MRAAPMFLRAFLVACCAMATSAATWADSYPSRAVRIIVPVAAGGGTDYSARAIAHKLSTALGQSVVVENRPGASGNIGAEQIARAAPDGYTLGMPITSFPVNPSLYSKLPFDTARDFAPVVLVGTLPLVLVVHPSVPAQNTAALIELARKKPGSINFANSGSGTTAHLAGELFKRMAKIDIVSVNYKGGGPAVTDLLGGQVQMYFATLPSVLPHIQAGKLRALAVTGKGRLAELPEVPTVAESGLPGFEVTAWFGLFAPAGTPEPIIRQLNAEVVKILATAEMQKSLPQHGIVPAGGSPQELGSHLREEIQKWSVVVKDAGIKVE
jgi:tripartite-type tricarboxylate transporter receptor subunit TctC